MRVGAGEVEGPVVVGGAAAVGRVVDGAGGVGGAGGAGPVGSAAERLARARRVLHRTETRTGLERSRPAPAPPCPVAGADLLPEAPARTTGTVDARPPAEADLLPVPGPLAGLLPGGGLRRGSTVAVGAGTGAGSLLFALLAAASAEGAWAGVVGRPGLGATAAAEAGVVLDRLALVPDPGADLVGVTAALLDGLDLVVVAGPERAGLRAGDRQRLAARARQRGAVLLALGGWPGADLRLHCTRPRWEGVGRGTGRLRSRRVEVRAEGRGLAPAGRGVEVLLPGPGGAVGPAPAAPVVAPVRPYAAPVAVPAPATAPGLADGAAVVVVRPVARAAG
ncbi:hypothetical protein [Pseudonocardia spirodelae]|uniref:Protein RecA n=1 Tax=Pseudonocardia spirodelae TaxID=3133431 RepID=A0ABU8T8Q7_9PSEU